MHVVHDVRGPGGNSGGRGPGAQRGVLEPKGGLLFIPSYSLSKHAQREQRAQPLCRSDFFVHDVHDVHDARGYNGRAI